MSDKKSPVILSSQDVIVLTGAMISDHGLQNYPEIVLGLERGESNVITQFGLADILPCLAENYPFDSTKNPALARLDKFPFNKSDTPKMGALLADIAENGIQQDDSQRNYYALYYGRQYGESEDFIKTLSKTAGSFLKDAGLIAFQHNARQEGYFKKENKFPTLDQDSADNIANKKRKMRWF